MPPQAHYGLGDALEVCYETAVDDWRRMYAPSTSREDVFSGPVTCIVMQTTFLPAGRAHVSLSVSGRRSSQSDVFFFIMQRHNNLWTFPEQDLADPRR